jgi:hypothetical protein
MARPIPDKPVREEPPPPFVSVNVPVPPDLRERLLAHYIAADEADADYYIAGTCTIRHWESAFIADRLEAGLPIWVTRHELEDYADNLPDPRPFKKDLHDNRLFEVSPSGKVHTVESSPWRHLYVGEVHPRGTECRRVPGRFLEGERGQ